MDVAQRIREFNVGRRPDTLALKFAKLRKNPFAFFRGTAHLFYQAAPLPVSLAAAPLAGLTGDLHLENFGAYRGANGLACFNVNDFDEALLGPVVWDLTRFVTSLYVAMAYLKRHSDEAKHLAHHFLHRYAKTLADGGHGLPDAAHLDGPIGQIIHAFPAGAAFDFLDDPGDLTASGRQLNLANKRFLPIDDSERVAVIQQVGDFARQNPAAGALRVLDVVRLVAGTSSLGLDRYAVLTEGEGASGANGLLELKEVRASCATPYLTDRQAGWPSQAARVVAAERLFQDVPPARLAWVGDAAKSFVVRDYSRTRDRLSVDDPGLGEHHLTTTVHTMAQLTAAGHLRGSAAEGASGASALQAFAQKDGWRSDLIEFARASADRSQADYTKYCEEFDRGELSPK
jgi:uncharacterized protein (DUF2252 family)